MTRQRLRPRTPNGMSAPCAWRGRPAAPARLDQPVGGIIEQRKRRPSRRVTARGLFAGRGTLMPPRVVGIGVDWPHLWYHPSGSRAGGAGGTALRRRHGGPGAAPSRTRVCGCSAGLAAALANGTSTTVDRCATWNAVRRSRLLIDAGNWAGRACPRRGCTCQLAAGTASATKTVQRRCCCTSPPAPPREAYFEGLVRGLDDLTRRSTTRSWPSTTTSGMPSDDSRVTALEGRSATRPRESCAQSAT